jgi:hypothetical protein
MRAVLLAIALTAGSVSAVSGHAAVVPVQDCDQSGTTITCTTFNEPERVVIPGSASAVHVELIGGAGGADGAGTTAGGPGGITSTDLDLSHGRTFDIYVGEDGGSNGPSCQAAGGAGGRSGGIMLGGFGGGGGGVGTCGGAGGGGASWVMAMDGVPGTDTPLAVAGGGGGAAAGHAGGRGGGSPDSSGDTGSRNGQGSANQGKRGDSLTGTTITGSDGTACDNGSCVGAGGGGAGYPRGGGGGGSNPGGGGAGDAGGGGGCGFVPGTPPACPGGLVETAAHHKRRPHFRATATGGSVTFTLTFAPPAGGATPGTPGTPGTPSDTGAAPEPDGHHGGNDPNPNTNPTQPTASETSRTATTSCNPRVGVCTVRPPAGSDSRFAVTARGGNSRALLFGTLMGGSRPNCPNYKEINTDWVAFGFRNELAGSSWQKTAKLTTRHKLSHDGAVALSRKMQVCFEAPYRFETRPGYELGGRNGVFDGVLPDCPAVAGPAVRGTARPCVASRQVLPRQGGWVVRFIFRVPANSRDPKALG